MSGDLTIVSIKLYLSCPSFKFHLSIITSTPSETSLSARLITQSSCCGVVQLYEINIFGISVIFCVVLKLPTTFEAWRCGGFLAQKFNRNPAVELCTNVC